MRLLLSSVVQEGQHIVAIQGEIGGGFTWPDHLCDKVEGEAIAKAEV
jgi:hypothetical protein